MANNFMGMFTTPQEVRQKQIDAERAAYDKAMLSGDAFMQGQAMGRRIGGSVGGMMGVTSAEEAKAAQLQDMAGSFDLDTSAGLTAFAKQLNDMGMTKEAVQVLEKRESVLDRERRLSEEDTAKAMREGKLRKGLPRIEMRVRTDSKGNPLIGPNGKPLMERVEVPTYERWSEKEQRYIPVDSIAGGMNDNPYMLNWGEYLAGQGNKVSDPSNPAGIATNMPEKGTGAHALKNKEAGTQAAMVQAYADYLKNLPAGSVPMEMDAWLKSQQ